MTRDGEEEGVDRRAADLSHGEFLRAFGTYFEREPEWLHFDSSLGEDLGFDSIELYELLSLLDSVAGYPVPEDLLPELKTIGDVYHAYCNYSHHS